MAWLRFVICLFGGFLGIHKFIEKKIGLGFLYLFTVGLCGIGWLYDCGKYLSAAIRENRYRAYVSMNPVNYPEQYGLEWRKRVQKVLLWVVVGFFALIALGDLAGGKIFAAIPALAAIAVVIPAESWQARIGGVIYGRRKWVSRSFWQLCL